MTGDPPMTQYNQFEIESNDLGEVFTAEVTDEGVYLEHNWIDGGLFISHDQWESLDEFRTDFLDEITSDTTPDTQFTDLQRTVLAMIGDDPVSVETLYDELDASQDAIDDAIFHLLVNGYLAEMGEREFYRTVELDE